MAVPSAVTTTFPASITASGESNGVLIPLNNPTPNSQVFITASGDHTGATIVIEARLVGMTVFTPVSVTNSTTSAIAGTAGSITLASASTNQFSFGGAPYDQVCVYASALSTGTIFVGRGVGPAATQPPIVTASVSTIGSTGAITSTSPTAGIGYATGAGGAQTQATDKTTTVVSNTITTAITLNNASLAAATIVGFTFTNSAIAATDTVLVTHQSAGTSGAYTLNAFPGAGSAVISVRNNTAGALAEAIVLRVTVIKSVSA